MRLIDADKITITRQEYVGALTLRERLQRLLNFQPTVDAIPIEWIVNWLNKSNRHYCDVDLMLDDWEKENESNI
jgi:hypothetical protein